jgi:hypothetical protein
VKEAVLRDRDTFQRIFNAVIDLIYARENEITEWAKKVDDLLKNQVYTALSKSFPHFDLESLIKQITEKLTATNNQEAIVVLIKWLEVLHSIQNVNILPSVPRFLEKLLINMEFKRDSSLSGNGAALVGGASSGSSSQKSEVSKKSVELLQLFIEEFKSPQTRTVKLDKKIINKLIRFLTNHTSSNSNQAPGGTGGMYGKSGGAGG